MQRQSGFKEEFACSAHIIFVVTLDEMRKRFSKVLVAARMKITSVNMETKALKIQGR